MSGVLQAVCAVLPVFGCAPKDVMVPIPQSPAYVGDVSAGTVRIDAAAAEKLINDYRTRDGLGRAVPGGARRGPPQGPVAARSRRLRPRPGTLRPPQAFSGHPHTCRGVSVMRKALAVISLAAVLAAPTLAFATDEGAAAG